MSQKRSRVRSMAVAEEEQEEEPQAEQQWEEEEHRGLQEEGLEELWG